jgi:hypothetical protein
VREQGIPAFSGTCAEPKLRLPTMSAHSSRDRDWKEEAYSRTSARMAQSKVVLAVAEEEGEEDEEDVAR